MSLSDIHVATTDPGCIKNKDLQRLFLMGRKYRVEQSVAGIRSAVEEGLLNYVKRLSRRYENVEHRLLIWKAAIMERLELRLQDLKRQG